MHEISSHRPDYIPDDTFKCPFCGRTGRIATFCLDGDTLNQVLCDNCGTPSYFSDTKEEALHAWMVGKDI